MNSMAFEGEAPETDDEVEDVDENSAKENCEIEIRTVSIDKNLLKHWSHVAIETVNICQKRSASQEKTMQKVAESASACFTSMQNAASKLNCVQSNVARLEDSVADLLDATKLIPDSFPVFKLDIPEFL